MPELHMCNCRITRVFYQDAAAAINWLCDAFGVIVEKTMYGKKRLGIQRSTFSIDAKGKIVKVWPKVGVDEHAEEVLSSLS